MQTLRREAQSAVPDLTYVDAHPFDEVFMSLLKPWRLGSIVFVVGLVSYAVISITTLIVAELIGAAYPGVLRFFGIVMVGGLLATLIAAVIGYYAATTTYRFGFDPDNHTIPLVTSGMDLLGVICLVIALVVFGVA